MAKASRTLKSWLKKQVRSEVRRQLMSHWDGFEDEWLDAPPARNRDLPVPPRAGFDPDWEDDWEDSMIAGFPAASRRRDRDFDELEEESSFNLRATISPHRYGRKRKMAKAKSRS